ncbi:hypothetical protein D3C83_213980 [compost metagenome]
MQRSEHVRDELSLAGVAKAPRRVFFAVRANPTSGVGGKKQVVNRQGVIHGAIGTKSPFIRG